jgi:hypothetical protein
MCERLLNGPTPQIDDAPARLLDSGDLYEFIETVANIRIEQLKALGIMQRESQITDEWEQDNHFDALADEFATVAALFGVVWPPGERDKC